VTVRVILSVVGSDRPGLTNALADAVHAAGGNWLESHLSRLGGKYVGSVLVEVDAAALPALEAQAREVDASGLRVSLVRADEAAPRSGEALTIELVGQDRAGFGAHVSMMADGRRRTGARRGSGAVEADDYFVT